MQWAGLLLSAIGVLMIGGYYLYYLFQYLFALDFMPFPVRLALPVVVVGLVVTVISVFWENLKKNRRERLEEVREQYTEHTPERTYLASQLSGSDD